MDTRDTIRSRRSVRRFQQKPISHDLLVDLVDAARLASSGHNKQPLKYRIIDKTDDCSKLFPCCIFAGDLKGAGSPKEDEAPMAYILIYDDPQIREAGYEYDVALAASNIMLLAWSEGIGSSFVGALNRVEIERLFPSHGLKLTFLVALGYPAEQPQVVEMQDGSYAHYVKDGVMQVPKRSLGEVLLK